MGEPPCRGDPLHPVLRDSVVLVFWGEGGHVQRAMGVPLEPSGHWSRDRRAEHRLRRGRGGKNSADASATNSAGKNAEIGQIPPGLEGKMILQRPPAFRGHRLGGAGSHTLPAAIAEPPTNK